VEREHRRLTIIKRRTLVAGATLGASAVLAANAQAATFTVNSPNDGAPDATACPGSACTLRDAIAAAGSGDTITFDSSLSGDVIKLTNGALYVGQAMTIDGSGAPGLAVSGENNDRVFYIADPQGSSGVTISNLIMENGYQDGRGGAVYNEYNAPLRLTNDTVKDSAANFNGGGIYTNGPLTVSGSTVTNNTSKNGGFNGGGGGLAGDADMTISDSHVDGNHATSPSGMGGGILVLQGSKLSLTNSTVSGNDAGLGGGGISDKYGNMAIEGSTISGNSVSGASGLGGGVLIGSTAGGNSGTGTTPHPVTIDKTTISGNQANAGAGVDIEQTTSDIPVTISASTLSGTQSQPQGSATTSGGGLQVDGPAAAPIEVIDSTLSGNTANHGAGVGVGKGDNGTAGPFDTSGSNNGSLTFDNTTIDSNSASTQNGGGGIYLASYYPNVDEPATATVTLNSTIVAGNTASGSGNDLSRHQSNASTQPGGFNASYSLIQNPGNAPLLTSNQVITGVDAQLGALGNNGGPTQTMLPADSSPVIDQGKAASGLTTDQRGEPRTVDRGKTKPPGGDGTDIGSVELPAIVKAGPSGGSQPPSTPPPKPQISAIVGPATGVTGAHATLNGKVNTSGLAVTWHFQWGKTTSYGKVTPNRSIGAGGGTVPVSFQVTGLSPGTVYHYRVVATSSSGQTATSSDATFKTPAPTINVNPSVVFAGNKVRVFGRAGGCPTGDQVTLISGAFSHAEDFAGQPAIHTKVRSGDRYSVITRIPAGRAPGRYAITARCGGGNFGVTAHLRVLKKHVRAVRVIRFTG
jgi:hypothetical protein